MRRSATFLLSILVVMWITTPSPCQSLRAPRHAQSTEPTEPSRAPARDETGDFEEGPGSTPENADSDYVPGLTIGQPTFVGRGCQNDAARAAISPDQRTLSILFDDYSARTEGMQGPQSSDCRVQIPFEIPAGFRMQVVKISYRGFASVPSGGQAIFETSFRFTEPDHRQKKQNFVIRRKKFVGPREDLFTISSKIRGPHWSPCGQRFTLLAESRIFVQSNSAGEEALATVDSLDSTTSPAVYHLRWKKCR